VCLEMVEPTYSSWDSDAWEAFGVLLLRQRYGVKLVPVPDKSGGDGGLDAYTTEGVAWQCYAPENEPLTAKQRFKLQQHKITTDLKKLNLYSSRVRELLGGTVLTEWVLLTPKHESANLVAHCATKSAEVVAMNLDFISPSFRVHVQDMSDFAVESRIIQSAGYLPGGLHESAELPDLDSLGVPFSEVTGPLIVVMDDKLKKVVKVPSDRAVLRGELLKSKIASDDHLAKFDDHLPDVGAKLRDAIARAKRRIMMEQAAEPFTKRHLWSVEADVQVRIADVVPELKGEATEIIAQGSITQWLQECTMTFDGESDSTDGQEAAS
jgi:hypothetical protein